MHDIQVSSRQKATENQVKRCRLLTRTQTEKVLDELNLRGDGWSDINVETQSG